ncbi:MAG: hypothetical protein JRI81_16500, partial [Deltaproteobacteria bacterium]|nr:hypothetical protein [Deltaproteobacteria bacterium]
MNVIRHSVLIHESWEHILSRSITSPADLAQVLDVDTSEIERVASQYPMRINP